ncbi:hypothetical protein RvY_06198 [Ramazzottius varieornatus]|uniref:TauD/TfdA-like domain-containing protein n=1 Tax=Ramazzottius varieornatus TaxID=947166 RepID=A0A1D1V0P9_RAMVA|nr:hypothetical protein RvY_06198 [Ramazzottius varieornatus]
MTRHVVRWRGETQLMSNNSVYTEKGDNVTVMYRTIIVVSALPCGFAAAHCSHRYTSAFFVDAKGHHEHVDPTTVAIGAVIDGLDLSRDLDKATMEQIEEALLTHQVIFFPKQTLTPEQQRDFAQRFGPLHIHPILPAIQEWREIVKLDTSIDNPPDTNVWHTDVTFIEVSQQLQLSSLVLLNMRNNDDDI